MTPKKNFHSDIWFNFSQHFWESCRQPHSPPGWANSGTHYDNVTMFIHKHLFCEVTIIAWKIKRKPFIITRVVSMLPAPVPESFKATFKYIPYNT